MMEEQQELVGREFVHFKGGHYRIEGFARDSETLEVMAIERDGKRMKGFELLEEKP